MPYHTYRRQGDHRSRLLFTCSTTTTLTDMFTPESYIRPTLSPSAMGFKINYAAISYSKRVHRCHQPFRPSAPALRGQFNLSTGGRSHQLHQHQNQQQPVLGWALPGLFLGPHMDMGIAFQRWRRRRQTSCFHSY